MQNRKEKSIRYLDHLLNTSDTKTAYSFSRGSRFQKICPRTPDKFYDCNDERNKRATSMGFGKKQSFINKFLGDPGLYETKGEFQLIKLKQSQSVNSTFGQSHNDIYKRVLRESKTPGPGSYYPQQTKIKSNFYMGKKVKYPDNLKLTAHLGPQTYTIDPNFLQRITKFKATQGFRIRTEPSVKSKLEHICLPGPGAYNPEKILSLAQISKSRTSSTAGCFSRSERLKILSRNSNIGPGSYQVFSVFGDNQDCN